MPPFREGPVKVDRRISAELLYELRYIGHGHQINIVDASYDIPRGKKIIDFAGSSADALSAIVDLIPIEEDVIYAMQRDAELEKSDPARHDISAKADDDFRSIDRPVDDMYFDWLYRNTEAAGVPEDQIDGICFYDLANNEEQAFFVRTIDDLPFACASLVVGHSQRTE